MSGFSGGRAALKQKKDGENMSTLVAALKNMNCPCAACRVKASGLYSVVEADIIAAVSDPREADQFLNCALANAELFDQNGWNVGALYHKGAAVCWYGDSAVNWQSTVPWELKFKMPEFGRVLTDAVHKYRAFLIEQRNRAEQGRPTPTAARTFAAQMPGSSFKNYLINPNHR